MGFVRTKIKWVNQKKVVHKKPKKLDTEDKICHALCALRMTSIRSHHLQKEVTNWICDNYGFVTPESVQRIFRKMVAGDNHVIDKTREGIYVRYEVKQLYNLKFDEAQGELFK